MILLLQSPPEPGSERSNRLLLLRLLLVLLFLVLVQNFVIVRGDGFGQITQGSIRDFHCVSVEEFVEDMASRDGGVKDLQKLGTNICLHLFVKHRIEPEYLSFP